MVKRQQLQQRRQGDLFFSENSALPPEKKRKTDAVLAYGEVTGHMHMITSPSLDEVEMFVDPAGDIWLYSEKDILIDHDEHSVITLPAGKQYKMTRQREYDASAADLERKVAD